VTAHDELIAAAEEAVATCFPHSRPGREQRDPLSGQLLLTPAMRKLSAAIAAAKTQQEHRLACGCCMDRVSHMRCQRCMEHCDCTPSQPDPLRVKLEALVAEWDAAGDASATHARRLAAILEETK